MTFKLTVFFLLVFSIFRHLTSCSSQFYFKNSAKAIPHPEKKEKGGEDAHFTSEKLIAVADGVGGWNEVGIDPSLYSRELIKNVETFFNSDSGKYSKDPKQLLIDSAENSKNKGSSTLVLLTLDGSVVNVAYIGDSGYLHYRVSEENKNNLILLYESPEQQKSFNFPYQIGHYGDPPDQCISQNHVVKEKDIFVVASDGILDNLDAGQIQKLLEKNLDENGIKCEDAAAMLSARAYELSLDKKYKSPFAKKAKKAGYRFNGGKSDDITVVVAQIELDKKYEKIIDL